MTTRVNFSCERPRMFLDVTRIEVDPIFEDEGDDGDPRFYRDIRINSSDGVFELTLAADNRDELIFRRKPLIDPAEDETEEAIEWLTPKQKTPVPDEP